MDSPTGRNPTLMWTSARQDVWNAMMRAHDRSPSGSSHDIRTVARLKELADSNHTGQGGQYPTFLFQFTGNKAYARKAWDMLTGAIKIDSSFLTPPFSMHGFLAQTLSGSANFVREYGIELAIMYDWLYPWMDATQRQTFKDQLIGMLRGVYGEASTGSGNPRWIAAKEGASSQVSAATFANGTITMTKARHGLATGDVVMLSAAFPVEYGGMHQVAVTGADTFTFPLMPGAAAPGPCTNLPTMGVHLATMAGDSDQLIGMYFYLAVLQCLFPTDPYVAHLVDAKKFEAWGGLAEPSYEPETIAGTINYNMRQVCHFYTKYGAAGGEWIEGSDYNKGTTRLLMMGAECTRTHYGVDHFPEVTQFQADWAHYIQYLFTPDLAQDYQWGDESHPRQTAGGHFTNTVGMLAGLHQNTVVGERCHDYLRDLFDAKGVSGFGTMDFASVQQARHLYTWNPYATRGDRTAAPKGVWAPGKGILLNRGGFGPKDSLFAFGGHTRSYEIAVDHDMSMFGDVQLYKNGEWVITHPWGGAGGVHANNAGANGPVIAGVHTGSPIACKIGECKRSVHAEIGSDFAYGAVVTGGSFAFRSWSSQPPPVCQEFNRSVLHVPGAEEVIVVFDRAHVIDPQKDIDAGQWSQIPEYLDEWKARLGRVWLNWHTPTKASNLTSANGRITYTTAGGQQVQCTTLLPDRVVQTAHDPGYSGDRGFGGVAWTTVYQATEVGSGHVHVVPATEADWQPFLTVWRVGRSPGTMSLLNAANDYAGVHVTRSGSPDLIALFNATAGPSLRGLPFGSARRNVLLNAWKKTASLAPVQWTAAGPSSDVFICQLDPARVWTSVVDGGPPQPLAVSAQGIARLTVAGAGAHSLTVSTTSRAPVGPDPVGASADRGYCVPGTIGAAAAVAFGPVWWRWYRMRRRDQ